MGYQVSTYDPVDGNPNHGFRWRVRATNVSKWNIRKWIRQLQRESYELQCSILIEKENGEVMKVKELLTGPERWTKGHFARSVGGGSVDVFSDKACCWCLAGAVDRCYLPYFSAVHVSDRIRARIGMTGLRPGISEWNDAPERTFEEVRALVEELDI